MSSSPASPLAAMAGDASSRPLPNLTADLPDTQELPDDVDALKELVRSSHTALVTRNDAITSLHAQLQHITSSHEGILTRSAEWKDELETLRPQVPDLRHQLKQTRAEKEELQDRVKDLRMRAEESRRAIMRLQGEQQQRTKADTSSNRRSTMFNAVPDTLEAEDDAGAAARSKASKRSTILFGAASQRSSRHVRTSSGGTVELPQPESSSNTYRGLRLGGGNGGDRLSPRLPQDGFEDGTALADSLATLTASRPTSSTLAPPTAASGQGTTSSATPRSFNLSPSPSASANGDRNSTIGSPILEQDGLRLSPRLNDYPQLYDEDDQAAATAAAVPASRASGVRVMQIVRQKEQELERLHSELRVMRIKLDEAVDAKRASDDCLKALKDFIGEGGPEGEQEARQALRGLKLPPLPTSDDDDGATPGKAAEPTWASKWATSLMSRGSKNTADVDGPSNAGGDAAMPSTSPSKSSGSGAPTTAANGLASFGALFSRSSAATAAATTPPAVPPKGSPSGDKTAAPPLSHRESLGSAAGSSSDGSGSGAGGGGGAGPPALNRLSTWFKRGPTAAAATPLESTAAAASASSPDPTALHTVDLSDSSTAGVTTTQTSPLDSPDTTVKEDDYRPAALSKEVPPNARAAKAIAKTSDVTEDGATLEEGGFVPPSFD